MRFIALQDPTDNWMVYDLLFETRRVSPAECIMAFREKRPSILQTRRT
jgi:hypothetical protein